MEPGLPVIYADQNRILQVLLNLVNNALRFTEQGGITIRASLSQALSQAEPEQLSAAEAQTSAPSGPSGPSGPSSVVISVTDTGVGIPAADTQRIFEPFIQCSNAVQAPEAR